MSPRDACQRRDGRHFAFAAATWLGVQVTPASWNWSASLSRRGVRKNLNLALGFSHPVVTLLRMHQLETPTNEILSRAPTASFRQLAGDPRGSSAGAVRAGSLRGERMHERSQESLIAVPAGVSMEKRFNVRRAKRSVSHPKRGVRVVGASAAAFVRAVFSAKPVLPVPDSRAICRGHRSPTNNKVRLPSLGVIAERALRPASHLAFVVRGFLYHGLSMLRRGA